MSGRGANKYRIIQYALVATDDDGKELGTLTSFVQNDGPSITAHAFNVHGIDSRVLDSEGAPTQEAGMRRLVEFLARHVGDGPVILVAHNGYSCDFKFLHWTLQRLGLALPDGVQYFADTLRIARQVEWDARPVNFKLGTLYQLATGRGLHHSAHDALADTRALATVFFRLAAMHGARSSQVHAWAAFQRREAVRVVASLAARVVIANRQDNDDSDCGSDCEIDSDSDSDSGVSDDTAVAGHWVPCADEESMERDPEDLFRASHVQPGVKSPHRLRPCNPWQVFMELYRPVEDLLVEETNRYAHQKRAALRIKHFLQWCVRQSNRPFSHVPYRRPGLRQWRNVTRREMRAFWGIALRWGLTPTSTLCWGAQPSVLDESCRTYAQKRMGRARYEQIKRFLHASDSARQPRRGSSDYDAGYKIRGLFQAAMRSWNNSFDPGAVVSIDETLLSFEGRFAHRTTIRSTRHQTGIKLYVATGVRPNYVVAVDAKCSVHERGQEFEGTKVVKSLMQKAGLLDQYRTVCTDDWYTSTQLLKAMRERNTYAYGVLRGTRVPSEARFTAEDARQPRGFSKTVYSKELDAMVVGWKDNKVLYCLSNATSSKGGHKVTRRVRGVGRIQVDAPDTLRRYNLDMGGVDWVRLGPPCRVCCPRRLTCCA